MIFRNITEVIGNTPLVEVKNHFALSGASAQILLKLEWFNMGGSTKDRIALNMVKEAEKNGALRPGMTIIESSSGNTAIGLAIVAAQRGYRFVAICDRHLPIGKRNRLLALGAQIVFIPPTPEGMDTVEIRIALARKLAARIKGCATLEQYGNKANVAAHYAGTGAEILMDTAGQLDACVIFCGTCGSVSGIGQALKERNPQIRVIAVEPEGSAIFGGQLKPYLIAGGGLSFVPSILDRKVVDEVHRVSDLEAFRMSRELAGVQGIMVGSSGGGVAHVAMKLAASCGPGKRIVGVIPDIGDRYIDSLFDDEWLRAHGLQESILQRTADHELVAAAMAEGCNVNAIER
ncbi:MAG: hypothetical protein A2X30_09320 [Elusimicrobia bacterium GWB2_63_16]|nr:MAG: hypothetical protein A2X30_09320 [Elusimicrobia bacterium GWB2_63_16]